MFARLTCFIRRDHHYRLRAGNGRMFLECARCGERSPGWAVETRIRPFGQPVQTLRLVFDEGSVAQLIPVNHHHPSPAGVPGRSRAVDDLRLSLD